VSRSLSCAMLAVRTG